MEAAQYLNIRANLMKKYDRTFNFFQVKPINEITYDQTLKVMCIAFKDVAFLLDLNQYLKRYYYLSNKANRNEISQRIKMLSEFYNNNLVLKYEYPTMIVTNTRNVFQKKLRRMRKMVANDNSSQDSSEENSQSDVSFDSSIFLKSIRSQKPLSKSSNSSESSSEENIISTLSFEMQQVHKIYQNPQSMFDSAIKKKENSPQKNLKDVQVNHLICDFDEVDKDYIFAMYKKANKKVQQEKNRQKMKKKITFNEINHKKIQEQKKQKDKKTKPGNSSIVITPLDFEELKGNKNITTLYPRPQHKSQYDETIRPSKNYDNSQKQQTHKSELYLPLDKKNNQGPNFQKSRKSELDGLKKDNHKIEGNERQSHNSGEKWTTKKVSPQMGHPRMGSPKLGSPKMGSPGAKVQQKKVLKHDNRKIEAIKQKAMSVLHNVKSQGRLSYKNHEMK